MRLSSFLTREYAKDAIDAGFHLDFYIHFRSKGYNALFQTDSYDYVDRGEEVKCFFNREGGGNIRAFTDEFMENLAYISGRGHMCMPTGNHDMIRYSHRRTQEEMKVASAFIMLMPSIPFVYDVTSALLRDCGKYPNFVLSSGCDIPPRTPWKNIDAFFRAAKDYYRD